MIGHMSAQTSSLFNQAGELNCHYCQHLTVVLPARWCSVIYHSNGLSRISLCSLHEESNPRTAHLASCEIPLYGARTWSHLSVVVVVVVVLTQRKCVFEIRGHFKLSQEVRLGVELLCLQPLSCWVTYSRAQKRVG